MELPFREISVVSAVVEECHFHHFPLISSSSNSRRLFEDCCRCRLKMPFGRRPSLVDRRRCPHHRHYNSSSSSSSPLIQRQTMAAEVQLQQQR